MKQIALCAVALTFGLCVLPLAAQDAGTATADDIFNTEETVTQTTQQNQNAAPRNDVLTSAAPWITGSFTGKVGLDWSWSDVWSSGIDLLSPTAHSLDVTGTSIALGFVARPDSDISVSGQIRAAYPFVKQIAVVTTRTFTVPDLTVWSLYSKFSWMNQLFFSFGKQPLKWGTGYFFSPADDIFAQSAVDITNPTAERQGPLSLKVQFPIPSTLDNLYLFAVLPSSTDLTALTNLKPEDIAVAGKGEFLFGNTELALAGYYQRNERPRVLLTGTTGTGSFNFFAEGIAAFPGAQSEAHVEEAPAPVTWGASGSSAYTVVDRKGDTLFSATAGAMYTNSDRNFTAVGQYLYNGPGYSSLTLGDMLQAVLDRSTPNGQPSGEPAFGYANLASSLGGLGRFSQHYGVVYLGWSSLWKSKVDFSLLAIANLNDGSGYVTPTVSFTCFNYVKLSASPSFSWGADGTEFADPAGLIAAISTGNMSFVPKPTVSLSLSASVGTVSF